MLAVRLRNLRKYLRETRKNENWGKKTVSFFFSRVCVF